MIHSRPEIKLPEIVQKDMKKNEYAWVFKTCTACKKLHYCKPERTECFRCQGRLEIGGRP